MPAKARGVQPQKHVEFLLVSPHSVSNSSCTQDRQPDITDLLNFEEPTVENWDRIYQEEDQSG
jgi:hypothetical protein